MSAGVLQSGTDYWFYIEIGGGYTWRLKLEDLANHPINSLTDSLIYQDGTLIKTLSNTGSVWEYALVSPVTANQIGNAHGADTQQSITFYIDDVETTPGLTLQSGTELRVVRVSTLDNEGDPASNIGTVTTAYTMTDHLQIDVEVDWVSDPGETGGYVGMWPFVEDLDRGFLLGYDVLWALDTATVSNLATPTLSTTAAMVFEAGGGWGQLLTKSPAGNVWIQDRPTLGKIYPSETPSVIGAYVQTYTPVVYRVAQVEDYATVYNLPIKATK